MCYCCNLCNRCGRADEMNARLGKRECPQCHVLVMDNEARACPRCGGSLPPSYPPLPGAPRS